MKAIVGILVSVIFFGASKGLAQGAALATMGPVAASMAPTNLTDAVEQTAFPRLPVVVPQLTSVKGAALKEGLTAQALKCEKQSSFARGLCLTSMNPKIAAAASAITVILAAMDATAGQKNSCEKFGSAMDIAKAAVTAYTTACGGARMYCTMTCENLARDASSAATSLRAAAAATGAAAVTAAEAAKMNADATQLDTWVNSVMRSPSISTSVLAQCDKYKLKLAAGAAGLINIVQSAKGGKSCEDQLTAGTGDGSLDCSKPENAQVIDCMCRTNPTLAGCAGGGAGSNDPYQNLSGDYSESSSSSDSNVDLSATPAVDTAAVFASESGSGGMAGFNGGGGGQGGIAGNGSGKAADGGKGTGRGLNKNILSGYEGGGGGGGAGSSAGYSDDGYANQFKAFMPGGDKDPSRNPANAVFAGGQVTGAGSKSNWEKVSERYQANRPSFIQGGP